MNSLLEHALKYASLSWKIIPIVPCQKVPLTKHGIKDASSDTNQIRAWWKKWPNANIAVACGAKSGVYVIDVDVSATGDVNGLESLREFPALPETIQQNTPRGGAHFFFCTNDPPPNRNSFRPGIDIRGDGYYVVLTPSIHPNGGVYAWTRGCAPWDRQPAGYPEYMRPVKQAPWSVRETPIKPPKATVTSVPHANDTLRRASLWLAECDPAVQGQGGHDKLFWAAQGMVNGCDLTDSQAYDLLVREYNPRCVPPWDLSNQQEERDFRRKIAEARKNPPRDKSRRWIIDNPEYATVDTSSVTVDIAALLKERRQETTAALETMIADSMKVEPLSTAGKHPYGIDYWIKKDESILADAELQFLVQPTGLLGEICSWINSTAIRSQPFLTLACSLAFLGVLYGRKIKDAKGGRTNLYNMGIARSSAGKAHAPNQIRRLCEVAECMDLLGGDDIASDSAIEDKISRKPATLFLWDEVGHLLAHIKSGKSRHHAQVVSLLMKLYSAAGSVYLGKEYAEKDKQRVIVQPCCCIYGMSTPERFSGGISPEDMQDGFLGRCLVFYSNSYPAKNRGLRESLVPEGIVTQCKEWRSSFGDTDGHSVSQYVTSHYTQAPPQQITIESTIEAEAIFVAFDNEATKHGKTYPEMAVLWAKGEENARRIALIIAASENAKAPEITASAADYSCRLLRYLLESFRVVLAPEIVSGVVEQSKRKIVAAIRNFGSEGCAKAQLTRATQWANRRQRDELLEDLIEAEEVVRELRGKALHFWTLENFVAFKVKEAKQ